MPISFGQKAIDRPRPVLVRPAISFKPISLNQPPRIGYGYIYVIEHFKYQKNKAIGVSYYTGLTNQTVFERLGQHVREAKKLNWRPNDKPLYTAMRTSIGIAINQDTDLLDTGRKHYFNIGIVEHVPLVMLANKEREWIAKTGFNAGKDNIDYRDTVYLKSYNLSGGGENDPLSRAIATSEIILSAYYYFNEYKGVKDIRKMDKNELVLLYKTINEYLKFLKSETLYKNLSVTTVPVIERILSRYFGLAEQPAVGEYLEFILRSGERLPRLVEKMILEISLRLVKEGKPYSFSAVASNAVGDYKNNKKDIKQLQDDLIDKMTEPIEQAIKNRLKKELKTK